MQCSCWPANLGSICAFISSNNSVVWVALSPEIKCWAVQVWYSVPPSEKQKLERMAQAMFPDHFRNCRAFMRHKEVLFSPKVMDFFNVKYVQVSCGIFCLRNLYISL